jgi:hypothetical protein
MNRQNDEHPREEKLTEYALLNKGKDIEAHILSCPSCSRYIKEIRSLKKIIQLLPDEEIPYKIKHNIIKSIKKNRFINSWFEFSIIRWHKNPFIIVLGITAFILFLYIYLTLIL